MANKTAALLIIGNEILSGRTRDANMQFLGQNLAEIGINFVEARVIRDIEKAIIETILELSSKYDYVFTTGGIGPTHDDITAASIAKAFNSPLILHKQADEELAKHYQDKDLEYTEARQKMAKIPQNASLIKNSVSVAPGFCINNVFVMAGVPKIMQAMFNAVKQNLTAGNKIHSVSYVKHSPESVIATPLSNIQEKFPDIDIGSYPDYNNGNPFVEIILRGEDEDKLQQALKELQNKLK